MSKQPLELQPTGTLRDSATADNAVATATLANPGDSPTQQVRLTDFSVWYDDDSTNGTVTIKSGTTELVQYRFRNGRFARRFNMPLIGLQGDDITVELSASGSAGVVGEVHALGYAG